MPRFVVLIHDHPTLHWDLLLEQDSDCRTWRLLSEPSMTTKIEAESIFAHRKHYLDYEGPVSGNRGNVTQWDHGRYEMTSESEGNVEIELFGDQLQGTAELKRLDGDRWQFSMKVLTETDTEFA